MANDANVFKNATALSQNVIEENWAQEIEQVARQKNYFRNFAGSIVVMDRVGTRGQKEYITKNTALTASDVTDGDSVSISALTFNQVEVTSSIKAVATQITLKNLISKYSFINSILAIVRKIQTHIFPTAFCFFIELLKEVILACAGDFVSKLFLVIPKDNPDLSVNWFTLVHLF